MLGIGAGQLAAFLAFWALQLFFVRKGLLTIRRLETWTAPVKILICAALVWWAVDRAGGVGPVFSAPSAFAEGGPRAGQFWLVFWPALTAMVGYWATLALNIPDFTRFARSQKDQALGQALGLPPMMGLIALASVITTSATVVIYGHAIWDPVELAGTLAGPFVLLGLIVISVDTVSCNIAANLVSSAYDFSSLWPRRISYRTGGMITAAIGVLIMPWKLLETTGGYIFVWLAGYSALLGPIAGILIADYWLIRRTRLDVDGALRAARPLRLSRRLEPGGRDRLRRRRAAQSARLPQDRRAPALRLDRRRLGGRLRLCLVHRPGRGADALRGADVAAGAAVQLGGTQLMIPLKVVLAWPPAPSDAAMKAARDIRISQVRRSSASTPLDSVIVQDSGLPISETCSL